MMPEDLVGLDAIMRKSLLSDILQCGSIGRFVLNIKNSKVAA
jgi:hypothetical protein